MRNFKELDKKEKEEYLMNTYCILLGDGSYNTDENGNNVAKFKGYYGSGREVVNFLYCDKREITELVEGHNIEVREGRY